MNSVSLVKPRVHDEDIIADLRRVAAMLRKAPSISMYQRHGHFCVTTVRGRWGTWRMAMKRAGLRCREIGRRTFEPRREVPLSRRPCRLRVCLRCDNSFASHGPQNRVCQPCQTSIEEDED